MQPSQGKRHQKSKCKLKLKSKRKGAQQYTKETRSITPTELKRTNLDRSIRIPPLHPSRSNTRCPLGHGAHASQRRGLTRLGIRRLHPALSMLRLRLWVRSLRAQHRGKPASGRGFLWCVESKGDGRDDVGCEHEGRAVSVEEADVALVFAGAGAWSQRRDWWWGEWDWGVEG